MRALFSVTHLFPCTAMCLFCTFCFSQVIAGNTTDRHWSEKSPFTSSTASPQKTSKSKRIKKKTAPAVIEHTIRQTGTYPEIPIPTTNLGLRRPRFERLNDPTDHMQETPAEDNAYMIGNAKVNATYSRTQALSPEKFDKMINPGEAYDPTQEGRVQSRNDGGQLHLGMEYGVEKGHVDLSVDYARYKNKNTTATQNSDTAPDVKSFSLGYTYDFSGNTSFYGALTHTKYEKEGFLNNENSDDDITGVRFGVNHKF